jgi:transcriptional regulator with XRE-family HTH domain
MAGIHRTYSGGIETARRNPSFKNLFRLARALGVSLCQMFETVK